MKTNDLLIALLALIVGLALGWFIAGQNAQAPVAMAPGQGNTVVNNIYDYVPAASINANVYDTQTGGVIGQEQGEAGTCKFVGQGKLICPGFPAQNVEDGLWILAQPMEDELGNPAGTVCNGDSLCTLSFMNDYVNGMGDETLGLKAAAAGSGGNICAATYNRIRLMVENNCEDQYACTLGTNITIRLYGDTANMTLSVNTSGSDTLWWVLDATSTKLEMNLSAGWSRIGGPSTIRIRKVECN